MSNFFLSLIWDFWNSSDCISFFIFTGNFYLFPNKIIVSWYHPRNGVLHHQNFTYPMGNYWTNNSLKSFYLIQLIQTKQYFNVNNYWMHFFQVDDKILYAKMYNTLLYQKQVDIWEERREPSPLLQLLIIISSLIRQYQYILAVIANTRHK